MDRVSLNNDSIFNLSYDGTVNLCAVNNKKVDRRKKVSLKAENNIFIGNFNVFLMKDPRHKKPFIGYQHLTIFNPYDSPKSIGLHSSPIHQVNPSSIHYLVIQDLQPQTIATKEYNGSQFGFYPKADFPINTSRGFSDISDMQIANYLNIYMKDGDYLQLLLNEDREQEFISKNDKKIINDFLFETKSQMSQFILESKEKNIISTGARETLLERLELVYKELSLLIDNYPHNGINRINLKHHTKLKIVNYADESLHIIKEYETYSNDLVKRLHFINMSDFSNPELLKLHNLVSSIKDKILINEIINIEDYLLLKSAYKNITTTKQHVELIRSIP